MSLHELKTWPEPFTALWERRKRYEIRTQDRDFKLGDDLWLREWAPASEEYTGREITAQVTYLTAGGEWGLPPRLCVMSVLETSRRVPCDFRGEWVE